MKVSKTKNGLRFSQHGVVISELRLTPSPTHSVFDILAASIAVLHPNGPIGVLGFAGGGMIAPLQALRVTSPIHTCDLDRESYRLFRQHAPAWKSQVRWNHTEAVRWLQHRPNRQFALLMDDLSVSEGSDIVKPAVSWHVLPSLMRKKLKPDGFAVFNLMPPSSHPWMRDIERVAAHFDVALLIVLDDFLNRVLIAGRSLPSAREMSRRMRMALDAIGSRQAGKMSIRTLRTPSQ